MIDFNLLPMIVLIDIDGPLADFYGEFLKRWKIKHPDLPFVEKENRSHFDLKNDYSGEFYELTKLIYTEPGFAENLPANQHGIQAIRQMHAKGLDVFLCSSPLSSFDPNVLEKYRWVEKHLGPDFVKKLIMSRDKTLVKGDFLIDDKPEIKGLLKPVWKQIIYDMPYNRYLTDRPRLNQDWGNWENILLFES